MNNMREKSPHHNSKSMTHEQYHQTLDGLLEGCQIIGFDWRYIYINQAAARHGHQTPDQLINRTMMEAYPGIENTELFSVLKHCMEERTARQMENKFDYPDGSTGWFELSIQPVPDGLFILSMDITATSSRSCRPKNSWVGSTPCGRSTWPSSPASI